MHKVGNKIECNNMHGERIKTALAFRDDLSLHLENTVPKSVNSGTQEFNLKCVLAATRHQKIRDFAFHRGEKSQISQKPYSRE